MISAKELNKNGFPTTPEIDANLVILLERLNKIRSAWAKPMIITSGLRDQTKQDNLIAQGRSTAKKSKHLTGQAADVSDPNGALKKWIMDNMSLMEQIGFWFEDFNSTPTWIHMQIVPPLSGKRIFLP